MPAFHPAAIHPVVTPDLFRGPLRGKPGRMRERQPCVYILASKHNGTLYVGVTSNLIGRLMQHRTGTFDGFTRQHGITGLVWFEMADTMDAAIAAEKRIKRWRRDWKRNLIERDNPHWDDLAVGFGLEPLEAHADGPRPKAGVTVDGAYRLIARVPHSRPPR